MVESKVSRMTMGIKATRVGFQQFHKDLVRSAVIPHGLQIIRFKDWV
jgi:hypothetical protein